MSAPKGNEYYLLRSKSGRNTDYNPEELRQKANEYFSWVLENPLKEETLISRPWTEYLVDKDGEPIYLKDKTTQRTIQHSHKIVEVNKMRPFTLQGFCNFAEISIQTFYNYEKKEDFLEVIRGIRGIVENQQLEGAAAGFLNPNIIARKLGLVDKREIKADKHVTKYTPEERAKRLEQLRKKSNADT